MQRREDAEIERRGALLGVRAEAVRRAGGRRVLRLAYPVERWCKELVRVLDEAVGEDALHDVGRHARTAAKVQDGEQAQRVVRRERLAARVVRRPVRVVLVVTEARDLRLAGCGKLADAVRPEGVAELLPRGEKVGEDGVARRAEVRRQALDGLAHGQRLDVGDGEAHRKRARKPAARRGGGGGGGATVAWLAGCSTRAGRPRTCRKRRAPGCACSGAARCSG